MIFGPSHVLGAGAPMLYALPPGSGAPPAAPPPQPAGGGSGYERAGTPAFVNVAPAAAAGAPITGDLSSRPLPRLFHFIEKKKITGQMAIETPEGPIVVFFRDGWPVHVTTPVPKDTLGEVLLERRMLNIDHYVRSLELMRQEHERGNRLRHGEVLRRMNLIDEDNLINGLHAQLGIKLLRLFTIEQGRFAVGGSEHEWGMGETENVRIDPYWIIMAGIRECFTEERLLRAIRPIWNDDISLGAEFDSYKPRLGLGEAEFPVVRPLRLVTPGSPIKICNLAAACPSTDRKTVYALVFALWVSDLFEKRTRVTQTAIPAISPQCPQASGARAGQQGGAPAAGQAPAPTAKVDEATYRRRILSKLDLIKRANHFQVLEVGRSASRDEIHRAFVMLAQVYHPDRLPQKALGDLGPMLDEIAKRLGEAHSVLMNPENRKAYEASLDLVIDEDGAGAGGVADEGGGLARRLADAELNFKKGMHFFGKEDYANAEVHFGQAAEQNPQEGVHIAYYAWTKFLNSPEAQRASALSAAYDAIFQACDISPQSAPCFYLFGRVAILQADMHRQGGEEEMARRKEGEALKCFKVALALKPDYKDVLPWMRVLQRRIEGYARPGVTRRFLDAVATRLTSPRGKPSPRGGR